MALMQSQGGAPTRKRGVVKGRRCGGETSDAGTATRQGQTSEGDDKQHRALH